MEGSKEFTSNVGTKLEKYQEDPLASGQASKILMSGLLSWVYIDIF
jgi:hypothetical protein